MMMAHIWTIKNSQAQGKCYKVLVGLLLGSLFCLPAYAFEPQPFHLNFQAKIKGIHASLDQSLTKNPDNSYTLSQITKASIATIEETSTFRIQDNQIEPLQFHYYRSVFGIKTERQSDFDNKKNQAYFTDKKHSRISVEVPDNITDDLNFILAIQLWLETKPAIGSETIVNVLEKKSVRKQTYRLLSTDTWLQTDLGWFQTTVIQRIRDDKERYTKIWLANRFDYLLIKITHKDGDEQRSLYLNQGSLNGHAIQGMADKPVKAQGAVSESQSQSDSKH